MEVEDSSDSGVHRSPCAQCALPIVGSDESVECFGKCKLAIHTACLPGVTEVELNLLRKLKNCVYVCDACLALHDYDDRHREKVLDEIVDKFNEFACVIDLAKNFETKVKTIVSSELSAYVKRSAAATENSESGRVLRSTSKKRKLEAALAENKNDGTPKSGLTFADMVKVPVVPSTEKVEMRPKVQKKPDPVVIIKPKQGSESTNTREDLRKRINPKNMSLNKVIQGKDGTVTVVLKDVASSKLLKETVEKNMGEQYDVKMREGIKPTIKIVGLSDEMDEVELKETLVEQNDVFSDLKHFKLRKFYCNEKWKYAQYSVIVELDATTFFKAMDAGKLNVGWDRCRVFDGLDVTRCYKCCAFNHRIADCKAERETCAICAGEHNVKQCQSKQEKCVNCDKIRTERKLDIDINHPAWSSKCPVYMRFKKRRNEQVDYTA